MPVEEQVAIIFCGTNGLLQKVPVDKIHNFETEYLFMLRQSHSDILANLKAGKLIDDDLKTLRQMASDLSEKYAK